MARVLGHDEFGLGIGTYGIKESSREVEVTTRRVKGRVWRDRKTFSLTYYVLTEDQFETEADVQSATGIPPKFYKLRGCRCIAHHCKEINTVRHWQTQALAMLWEVTCDFDSDVDQDEYLNPDARTPRVRWTGEVEEEVLERDIITGAPIQTANYERILITGPVVVPILEITRYELAPFNPATILFFANRVNSTPFYGAPAGAALMLPMEAGDAEKFPLFKSDGTPLVDDEGNEVTEDYVPVTYRIKFKLRPDVVNPAILQANPWKARVLHQGYAYRRTASAKPEIHLDVNGKPSQVNLNLDGTENTGGTPAFLEFNRYAFSDLNALSLGPFA